MQHALKAYGEKGVLAHDLGEPERAALRKALHLGLPEGCLEYVAGYDTVLFVFDEQASVDAVSKWLERVDGDEDAPEVSGEIYEVPVIYNGADLEAVAEQTGLSTDEVVEIHSAPIYTVRMMGFTPGFPYLDGLDLRLHLPRKESPGNRIEPGSVAIGGLHAGIYSVASPGGWHLLGQTNIKLFDADAARGEQPDPQQVFLLKPGDRLRFQPVD